MIKSMDNPYKPGSYAQVYNVLYQSRQNGISRSALLKKAMKVTRKSEKKCRYDISIVLSPGEDGSSHRSARTASNIYWVEKQNDWFKLHLRDSTD